MEIANRQISLLSSIIKEDYQLFVVSDQHSFHADPEPAKTVNADPFADPDLHTK